MRSHRLTLLGAALALATAAVIAQKPTTQAADEPADGDYGTITGQFVVDGDVPAPKVLVAKGDNVNDPAICSANDVLSDKLRVDAESKGVADVFIYLPKTEKIHPKLKTSEVKEVILDQKGCRFDPHALFVRTDQSLVVKSNDDCSHNSNFMTIRNQPINFVLAGNDRTGTAVKFKVSERLPMPVVCNIHNWMRSTWLVLDHPYAAISDAKGKFKIADMPAGEHELHIWHEVPGNVEKKYKVTVKKGETIDLGRIKIPAEKLFETK
ncbi:MAG: hypothetical protein EXS05_16795 [Planctomycetaceae bacterium]|nr:hypothetical protein [Planctomycetaceae bacterium]